MSPMLLPSVLFGRGHGAFTLEQDACCCCVSSQQFGMQLPNGTRQTQLPNGTRQTAAGPRQGVRCRGADSFLRSRKAWAQPAAGRRRRATRSREDGDSTANRRSARGEDLGRRRLAEAIGSVETETEAQAARRGTKGAIAVRSTGRPKCTAPGEGGFPEEARSAARRAIAKRYGATALGREGIPCACVGDGGGTPPAWAPGSAAPGRQRRAVWLA